MSRVVRLRVVGAFAVAVLALPACGGDDGAGVRTIDDGGSASGSGSTPGSGSGSAAEATEATEATS